MSQTWLNIEVTGEVSKTAAYVPSPESGLTGMGSGLGIGIYERSPDDSNAQQCMGTAVPQNVSQNYYV